MKIGIIGPRDLNGKIYDNQKYIDSVLNKYRTSITLLTSGGGKGVESLVRDWAERQDVAYRTLRPNIQMYGKHDAFIYRNQAILKEVDLLIMFWDGCNTSAFRPLPEAISQGKQVHIIPML